QRFWSVRNLDLVLLILLAPGLLMVNQSREKPPEQPSSATPSETSSVAADVTAADSSPETGSLESRRHLAYVGYLWLFAVSMVWLVRLLLDPTMVRRPLLEPSLRGGNLTFMGCALFAFLMANVITSDLTPDDLNGAQGAEHLLNRHDPGENARTEDYTRFGPGYYFLHLLPSIPTHPFIRTDDV